MSDTKDRLDRIERRVNESREMLMVVMDLLRPTRPCPLSSDGVPMDDDYLRHKPTTYPFDLPEKEVK